MRSILFYRAIRAVALLFVPGFLMFALYACNTINPLSLGFRTEFWVTNKTTAPVLVTPVGTVGQEGYRTTLNLVRDTPLYLPVFRFARFAIAPGETRKFVYDWDDVQFSEISIEASGQQRVIIVDPEPTKRQYTVPEQTHFVVSELAQLPHASSDVAAISEDVWNPFDLYWLISILAPPAFFLAGRKLRALQARAAA